MALRARDQRGLSESVQYAMVLPTLLLGSLGIVQAGLWIHGGLVAARAANAAVDVARGSYGNLQEARETAVDLASAGGLTGVDVQVGNHGREVRVTVSGTAPVILRLGLGRVSETATAPREQISQP